LLKNMKNLIIAVILALILSSCGYSVYTTGYPHLKTIAVIPFENKTTEYEIEDELFTDISNRFDQDGRLSIVTISPDCQLEGKIMDYSDKIHSYDVEGIEEYRVKILFSIIFTDLKKNEIIYQNDALVLSEDYSSGSETAEFSSTEEARYEIYELLFDNLIRESLDQW